MPSFEYPTVTTLQLSSALTALLPSVATPWTLTGGAGIVSKGQGYDPDYQMFGDVDGDQFAVLTTNAAGAVNSMTASFQALTVGQLYFVKFTWGITNAVPETNEVITFTVTINGATVYSQLITIIQPWQAARTLSFTAAASNSITFSAVGSQTYTHAVIDQVRVMAGGNWINSNVLAGIETLPVTVADSFEYPILANKQAAYGGVVALYPNDTQPFYLASRQAPRPRLRHRVLRLIVGGTVRRHYFGGWQPVGLLPVVRWSHQRHERDRQRPVARLPVLRLLSLGHAQPGGLQ